MQGAASTRRTRVLLTLAALGLVVGAFGGFASGAIPNSANGKIFACFQTASGPEKGELRLIDNQKNPSEKCTSKEIAISWNQQGPAGPTAFSTLIKRTAESPGGQLRQRRDQDPVGRGQRRGRRHRQRRYPAER